MIELSGWGRYPRHATELLEPAAPGAVPNLMQAHQGIIARGNGRAYGDAAVGERVTLGCTRLDRMRSFDPGTGRLTVEAGTLLSDVLDTFVPRGFFPPVVPGTKFVTIGGMIAADVHGKNHHRSGGFGSHVEALSIALPDGTVSVCSPTEKPQLFYATIGGMGLTGTILEATFRLCSISTGWIRQETVVAPDLASVLTKLRDGEKATYSVAWVDTLARGASLGRSLVFNGEHASPEDLDRLGRGAPPFPPPRRKGPGLPIDLPDWALNPAAVGAFNALYFRRGAAGAGKPVLVHWQPYFFPLDGIGYWNRFYGRRGFVQHQCVIPDATAATALGSILERISARRHGSFLAVLKRLGPAGGGTLSFPLQGYTLALDFPASKEVMTMLDEIDRIVVEARGRIYLAKDGRQSRETFEAGYPGLPAFRNIRCSIGAEGRIVSKLSARLGI